MKFDNMITYYLDSFHSADLRPVEIAGGETWEEDSATESSLDLGSESTPDLQIQIPEGRALSTRLAHTGRKQDSTSKVSGRVDVSR
jgi:hypothetical protein